MLAEVQGPRRGRLLDLLATIAQEMSQNVSEIVACLRADAPAVPAVAAADTRSALTGRHDRMSAGRISPELLRLQGDEPGICWPESALPK